MSGNYHCVRATFKCSQCDHPFSMVFRGRYFDILQQMDEVRCVYCGRVAPDLKDFHELHLDHLREYIVWV